MHQIEGMGIPNLFVMDDTYTNNKKRILALSQRICDEGINLRISVQLRLDQIDREVCDAMWASGVRYVGPGIESGSEPIMKAIGKGPRESKVHMREKIALLKEYGWMIRCSYVFGMVGETEADILETIAFAKELKADESAFSILTPYPDSPLWAVAVARGLCDEYMDFDRFLYYHTVGCNLSEVPTERLLELHEMAYKEVGSCES
jgi:anaerobic magnesium-protoporphyrin IX monomethyl ester cyclase